MPRPVRVQSHTAGGGVAGALWQRPPSPLQGVRCADSVHDAAGAPPDASPELLSSERPRLPPLRGRVSTIVWQAGTTLSSSWLRARYVVGVSPTSSVNRVEKEPRLVQPTAKQTSVTLRSPRRSSAFARSMRRVIR